MLKIATGEVYEPKFQEGAEPGKPYRFHINFLKPGELDMAASIGKAFNDGNSADMGRIFLMGVKRIENFQIEVSGTVITIESPEDFLKYNVPYALYMEVITEILHNNGMTEKERKN